MIEVDSRTETLVETGSFPLTSVSRDSPWGRGQPPAKHYDFILVGQRLEVIGEVYARPEPWVGPQLRPDQSWFWTPQWQAMESEATNDLATGSYEDFDTVDDFIEDLERLMEE